MAEQVKKVNGIVNVSLTKHQAEWLYDLLAETFDAGASTGADENMCGALADKLDVELGKI
jgi:hypothetical protein